jgi:hypothetical protein
MRINKIFEAIAKSKAGQKFYKWCASPGKDTFLNNTLPQVETVLSTACYVWSTAKQKNIDDDRKKLLQIQNVGSGAVGLVLGTAANRWISKKTDLIVKDLDPTKLDPKALRKVSTGLRVFAPIVTTAMCMRFLIPCAIAMFSGKVMDKEREKRQQQLNVKA